MNCSATSRRFDLPLDFACLVGNNPQRWINNLMAFRRRIEGRSVGLYTLPYSIRNIYTKSVAITRGLPPDKCAFTEEDDYLPDPNKIARCLISKPTISQMGEEEEKVYCGMTYGPDYSVYEHKARKRISKTLKKMLVKYVPKMVKTFQKRKKEIREAIKKELEICLEKEKRLIFREVKEALKQKEIQLANRIKMERSKAVLEYKGLMEEEINDLNRCKKEYLTDAYGFQIFQMLKSKEQPYLQKMNLYSSVWNKIFLILNKKAKQKVDVLNRFANQLIDEHKLKVVRDKMDYENARKVMRFQDEIQKTVKKVSEKVMAEDFHINLEKSRGEKIQTTVKVWKSLLKHVVQLFDKVIIPIFEGKPGECNYFLTRTIGERFRRKSKETIMVIENASDELEKEYQNKITDQQNQKRVSIIITKSEEELPRDLSNEKSYFTIDMSLNPPDKDLIVQLKLFQVKKLIEETTCALITKPLQIAEFMKDQSVELMPFNEKSNEESSYLLNKLSDAYQILQKMLIANKRDPPVLKKFAQDVPFTIENDTEVTRRVNSLIKAYRRNPDHIKALTNV